MNKKLVDLIFALRYFFSPNFKNEINKVNFNEKRIVIFDVGAYHGQFINEIGLINKKNSMFIYLNLLRMITKN